MRSMTRRSAFAALATAMLAPLAARAQSTPGSTVGPSGGVSSTTAPSNSAGTPAGGTGVISTTRVGPSTTAPMPASPATPMVGGQMGTSETTPTHHRRRRRRRHHSATTSGTSATPQ